MQSKSRMAQKWRSLMLLVEVAGARNLPINILIYILLYILFQYSILITPLNKNGVIGKGCRQRSENNSE